MKAFDLKRYLPENKKALDKIENHPATVLLKEEKEEYPASNQYKSLNEILMNWKEVIMKNSFVNKYVQMFNQNNT